ncbi:MAG: ATP-binding cassette domain-containing protein [Lewinella sp.]|nr:ATP-binding cassette domain-containing protein [Lewinella sp.]
MNVEMLKVGKRYDREWVIRDFTYAFSCGQAYGIAGRNGAGKSTLLRMLASHLSPSTGVIKFITAQGQLQSAAKRLSFAQLCCSLCRSN